MSISSFSWRCYTCDTQPLQLCSVAERSARQVAALAHPSWSRERVIIVLKAYLDASGTDPRQRVVAVAGFAASEDKWTAFEAKWRPLITEELELRRWHNTDFHSRQGDYRRWRQNDPRWEYAPRQICSIIKEVKPFAVGAGLLREDWQALQDEGDIAVDESPIRFCLDHCLESLIHRLHEIPKDDGIAIFVDRDENENIAREVTDWHIDYYRNNDEMDDPLREINLSFGSDRQFIPIQTADILANETYRYMHLENGFPFLGAETVDGPDPQSPSIIEAIKKDSYLVVECFSRETLKLIHGLKKTGAIRPDGRNVEALSRYPRRPSRD